ncbi:NAD(P)H-binding protein [Streptomyces zingiberis]|uniref:NAD(P)H-binding protein n=1 Tax=Streptomyces zingiberis TaxID=2053010 RepID=A0ABX1BQW5_9ACTN|nr:NAD(P)H-binding protein [Streptomyces zingiberis]NJQ00076.1 NAD(P)H-binding protein [Streptomyces zingiberis]
MSAPSTRPATLVVGATATTGSRVAARLVADGRVVRAASRKATPVPGARAVRFDWYAPETHAEALSGADRVYLVPPPGATDPAAVMLPFLERAREAGVRRAVLLGASPIPAGGPGVGQVHQALPGLFEEWAVLRPSWFMQNLTTGEHLLARSVREEGVIATATGDGRVAFVDADDIAAVAFHALTDARSLDADPVITGPETLSYAGAAAVLTEVTGRPVSHRQLTYEQARDRWARELPADFAAVMAGLDLAIADGAEDRTTDTVLRITGRPPTDFRTHVRRAMAAGRR